MFVRRPRRHASSLRVLTAPERSIGLAAGPPFARFRERNALDGFQASVTGDPVMPLDVVATYLAAA